MLDLRKIVRRRGGNWSGTPRCCWDVLMRHGRTCFTSFSPWKHALLPHAGCFRPQITPFCATSVSVYPETYQHKEHPTHPYHPCYPTLPVAVACFASLRRVVIAACSSWQDAKPMGGSGALTPDQFLVSKKQAQGGQLIDWLLHQNSLFGAIWLPLVKWLQSEFLGYITNRYANNLPCFHIYIYIYIYTYTRIYSISNIWMT